MTGKHTPGAWRIGNLESYDMEGTPFRRVYFNMKSDDIAEAHIRGEWCDENASLIAAAPDLAEALIELIKDAEVCINIPASAYAALRKAGVIE